MNCELLMDKGVGCIMSGHWDEHDVQHNTDI